MQRPSRRRSRALVATVSVVVASTLAAPSAGAAAAACGPFPPRHAWAEAIGVDGTVRWTTPLPLVHDGGQDNQPPVATATTGYFAQEGVLRALSLADGQQLWAQTAGQAIYGEWLVAGGIVTLADQVGKHATLTRYDAVTGAEAWRYAIPGDGLYGSQYLTKDGGLVWLREGGTLQVIDLRTGKVRWSRREASAQGVQYQSPRQGAYGGLALFAAQGRLVAYDDRTGKVKWTVKGLAASPSLQVSGGLALSASNFLAENIPATITAIDLAAGRRIWRYDPKGVVDTISIAHTGVAIAGYDPYIRSGGRSLLVLQPRTGKRLWSANVNVAYATVGATPIVRGEDVVAVEGSLARYPTVALVDRDVRTGHVRWRVPLHGKAAQPVYVSVVAGQVIAQDQAPKVGQQAPIVAYSLATGAHQWTAQAPTYTQYGIASAGGELLTIAVDPFQGCAD
jgi:outer membrane protein assembly factor BamB